MTLVAQFRSFDMPSRMLMINQFGINIDFYMLMPYLAAYLAGPLGLAAWAVGLVLGVRNFSQQGMFVVGVTLADRLGYKPLIVAGCLLRTGGFALLAVAHSLPAVLLASAATGFAGALFNPAVRAYLAADAGDRRVEAFALFNIFYQAGILLGPLVGLALMVFDFPITAAGAAAVFAVLTVAQLLVLPQHNADRPPEKTSILDDWRVVAGNRSFLLFARGDDRLVCVDIPGLPAPAAAGLAAGAAFPDRRRGRDFPGVGDRGRRRTTTHHLLVFRALALRAQPGYRHGHPGCVVSAVSTGSRRAALWGRPSSRRTAGVSDDAGRRRGRGLPVRDGHRGRAGPRPAGCNALRLLQHHRWRRNPAPHLATGSIMGAARHLGVSELIWAGLVLVGITAALALRGLDRGHHLEVRSAATSP
ncbi:hypothetical protein MGAST_07695 [Mycobacterium gastri 'Wayne']|nr:hypothetical protein MGAST_07695 [Mycobacterium gastri 'Wayne']